MELNQPCALLWHGISSIIRKKYKHGYIILDVAYIAHAIDLISKHYKITQCTDDIIAQLCDFLQKRGFVVEQQSGDTASPYPLTDGHTASPYPLTDGHTASPYPLTDGHITISWPFYFLGPHQTNV